MSQRLLIADDSLVMRKIIREALEIDGWEIAGEAANVKEAIEKFQLLRPNAVTLDMVMGDAPGTLALQEILRIDPAAKVVVVSALNQTRFVSEAIRSGAHDFIVKPFHADELRHTLRACIEDEPA